MQIPELVASCARIIDDKKGFDIVILDTNEVSMMDSFVVASCEHPRQVHAIAQELERFLKSRKAPCRGVEGDAKCGWVVVDAGTFVVHLFTTKVRAFYDLEMLWGDSPKVEWEPALAPAVAS